ncbi:TPA: hypothetical protein ACHFOT_003508 [Klebsiella pneumoniae]|nr:hypothetical protein [Klebsiella pneumoniae]EIW9022164.1 hypothetical protein [Klebsiella pneumoniae]EJK9123683.1 hypothetical protein [Klebsiella pneumoniae]EKT3996585.1 hypothetical protein [Klebsiella pneumoniae]EKV9744289.1 hypothetical protein [Klebsiella pneumoniae]EKW0373252.1 hypothetical protein [Klebsiella pneumoniae]
MNLNEFSSICKKKLDSHFKSVEMKVKQGGVRFNGGDVVNHVFYPTMILCIESDKRIFSMELIGVSRERKPLRIKKRNNVSVRELTSLSRDDIAEVFAFKMTGRNTFNGLIFYDHNAYQFHDSQNHPLLERYDARIAFSRHTTHLIDFHVDFTTCMLSDCMIAYVNNGFFRSRYIYEMFFSSVRTNEDELRKELDYYMNRDAGIIFGVRCFPSDEDISWVKASHLINLVLNDKIHETTIGDYLNDHPEIICRALGYDSIVYEPSLKWVEKTKDNTDVYINPDALLKRPDGNYDICDFKKGLLKRKKITKDERRRRRFIDDVDEGIAQLDNYEEYFTYDGNKKYALDKYNVSISEPRKILIIGNVENTVLIEVEQALRGRKDNLVIDYDSLISYYVGSIGLK